MKRDEALKILVLIFSAALMVVASWYMPIHRDEAVFLTIGKRLVMGEKPYVDYFDHKMPGIYLVAGWLYANFGTELHPVRLLMSGVNLVSAILMFNLLKITVGKYWAWLGALAQTVFGIWYQGNFLMTESFITMTILLSLWLWQKAAVKNNSGYWLGVGASLAAGLWFKQTALVPIGVVTTMITFNLFDQSRWKMWLVFVFGLVIPSALLFGWLEWMGITAVFWQEAVVFNLIHYPPYPLIETLKETVKVLLPALVWWGGGFIGFIYLVKTKSKLWGWLGLSLLPLMLTRPYHHYWLQVLPFSVLAAVYYFKAVRIPGLLGWLPLLGMTWYYVFFVKAEMKPQLDKQLQRIMVSDCAQIETEASYFFSDCKPPKYFYVPAQYSP